MNRSGSTFVAQLDALFGPLFLVLAVIGIIVSFFVDGASGLAIIVAMGIGVIIEAWGEDYVSDLNTDEQANTLTLTLERPFSGKASREQGLVLTNIHRMRHEPRNRFRQKGRLHLLTHDGEEHIFRTMPAVLDLAKVNAAIDLIRRTDAPNASPEIPKPKPAPKSKPTAKSKATKA
jgi:hypothetical protein